MDNNEGGGIFAEVMASAAKSGQQPAVLAEDQRLTYQQLVHSVAALAGGLAEMGVQRGERVALLLPNCPQFVISYLAVTALGAVAVPVHCRLSVEEAAYILNHAQVQALISLAQFDPIIAPLRQQVSGLTNLLISGQSALDDAANFEQLISAHSGRADLVDAAQRDEAAVLIYTSGTTGRPKGAVLSHRNLLANARSCYLIRGNMTVRRALNSHFADKWLRRRGITASYGEYWQ